MRKQCINYCGDESGAVTIFVVVIFAFLMAFSGLIFDIGRIFNLHSEAQSYVDSVALAAAAELDGEIGSIERAVRAAVGDAQRGAILDPGFRLTLSNDNAINIQQLVFLENIDSDPAPSTPSPVAGDTVLCTYEAGAVTCDGMTQAEADGRVNFVLATATTETEDFILFPIAGFLVPGIIDQASVRPQALAGFTREICNFPPMVLCNPTEDSGGGGGFTASAGQQILLRTNGNSSSWAPGDFGFLDLTELGENGCSGGGANFLRCVLAATNPNSSCVSAEVDFSPGETANVDVGFNVRFDIFDSPFQNERSNPNFPPAINVTKGYVETGSCKLNDLVPWNDLSFDPALLPEAETVEFPKDPDVSVINRIGSGPLLSDLTSYWSTNNPSIPYPVGASTRYQLYLEEIALSAIPDMSPFGGENGNPTCSNVPPVANRRNIVVAVVNCIENGVTGSAGDVPVITFLEMFLTNPAGSPLDNSNHDIYAEVISVVEPGGDDGVLHEFPVLYR